MMFTRSTVTLMGLEIHFYGLCYMVAFFLCRYMMRLKLRHLSVNVDARIDNIITKSFLLAVLGGRIGYIILYSKDKSPIFFKILTNLFRSRWYGMDFRSGLMIGTITIIYMLYCNKDKDIRKNANTILSVIAQYIPLGIFIGRFGNFLNEEFMQPVNLGNITLPLCLFSMLTEGLLSFLIALIFYSKRQYGYLYFLIFYGLLRFINDFYRPNDAGPIIFMGLRVSQYICLLISLSASCILLYLYRFMLEMNMESKNANQKQH